MSTNKHYKYYKEPKVKQREERECFITGRKFKKVNT